MVNKNEIRLGNYFNYYQNSMVGYVLGLKLSEFSNSSEIYISAEGGGYTKTDIEDITPIEITEEILLKCSFEIYANMNNEYLNNGLLFFFGKGLICKIGEYGDLRISIKYLHQLQNIYYFLMGKELIVKL